MEKQYRVAISIFVTIMFLSACAMRPNNIKASYVSPLQYQDCSCNQLSEHLTVVNRKIIKVIEAQDKTADKDSVGLILRALIFFPAILLMAGGDRENELAQLKGEQQALELMAMQKGCDITEEIQQAKKQREKYDRKRSDLINQTGVGDGEVLSENVE